MKFSRQAELLRENGLDVLFAPTADNSGETGITCLDDVEVLKTSWLEYPYIPRGKIIGLLGDPGNGKTWLGLRLAADISTGRPFFGGESDMRKPESVIYQSSEDGLGDTIKPRLVRMQPDFKRIFIIDEGQAGLTLSDARLENALQEIRPALLVIDPLQAYLGAEVDFHRANEVRPVLAHLGRLAEQYNCAIILTMHMSKASNTKALYRSLGSIDIPAAARSLLVLGNNPENIDQKILAHEKSSLAKRGPSLAFHIDPDNGGVVWDGESELTADQITGPRKEGRDKPSASLSEAVEFIEELLQVKGYAELGHLKSTAAAAGISRATLYRAKDELGLKTSTIGFSRKITWWALPEVDLDVIPSDEFTSTERWPPVRLKD